MKDDHKSAWGTIAILILFIIYESFTIVFQFMFLLTGDLIEMGFDILFIVCLVFFYDIDALILLVELIPFIDIIPLFAIYMFMKLATIDQPRKPLIAMDWFNWSRSKEQTTKTSAIPAEPLPKTIPAKDKIILSISDEEKCVICMKPIEHGDEVVMCVNGHLAHVSHIQPWTESMDREYCPVCRVRYPKVLISKTYV